MVMITIYCDKIECNLGETILLSTDSSLPYEIGTIMFTINKDNDRNIIDFYEDNVLIVQELFSDGNYYNYTPLTVGTHTITIRGRTTITAQITVTDGGDSGVTWTIGNKEVKSLTINNKEVKSILRTSDNTIIYEKGVGGSSKIDTHFTIFNNYYLQLLDKNNNPIAGKPVNYYDNDRGKENTSITDSYGTISKRYIFIDWAIFDGDEEYNGCTYP